jgi:hypothetical protein
MSELFHEWFMRENYRAKYFDCVPDGTHPAYKLAKEAWVEARSRPCPHDQAREFLLSETQTQEGA